jgi:hypothetical protein
MLLLVHHPTDSHIGSLFVAGETFASYFVRERRDFELRNTHARAPTHTHTQTHTHTHASMMKIVGEKNWHSILFAPMLVDDRALEKGIEICFFRATRIIEQVNWCS